LTAISDGNANHFDVGIELILKTGFENAKIYFENVKIILKMRGIDGSYQAECGISVGFLCGR